MSEETTAQLPPGVDVLALTSHERDLLAAVHVFARTHGWTAHDWLGWVNARDSADATVAVRVERVGACGITIWRRASTSDPWPVRGEFRQVSNVGRAVDVLVEEGILPPYPWQAGQDSPRYWPTAAAYAALGA